MAKPPLTSVQAEKYLKWKESRRRPSGKGPYTRLGKGSGLGSASSRPSAFSVHGRASGASPAPAESLLPGAAAAGLSPPEAAGSWGGTWVLPLVLGAVAGAAMFPGEAFPLAAGYVVALLALGDRRRALAASLGCLLTMSQMVGPLRLAEQFLIFALAWLISIPYKGPDPVVMSAAFRTANAGASTGRTGDNFWPIQWRLPVGVLLGTLLLRVGMLYVIRAPWEMMVWAGGESLLELGAVFALIPAVSLHQARPQRLDGRHAGGLMLGLAGLAWAVTPVTVAGISLGQTLLFWSVLVLALAAGPFLAAPAGAGLGALGAAAGAGADTVGLLALAGLGAGLGRPWGKTGVLLGLLGSQLGMSLLGAHLPQVIPGLLHGLVAGGVLALCPVDWIYQWLRVLPQPWRQPAPPQEPARSDQRAVGAYLRRLSLVFDEMAHAFGDPVPASSGWEDDRREEETLHLFLQGVTQRVCQGCSAYRHCWETHAHHTYRDLAQLVSAAEQRNRLSLDDFPDGLRQRCIRQRQLLRAAGDTFQLVRVHRTWEQRFRESRELVPQQLRGVARLVRDLAAELESGRAGDPGGVGTGSHPWRGLLERRKEAAAGPAPLHLETALLRRAKDGSFVSGDSDARIQLDAHRLALVLSDGMGAGERAATESQAVVRVLRSLLEAGFDRRLAVKMVNSVLLLRSSEETFATIDMAILDLRSRHVEFLKIGAPPTFIKCQGRVDLIRGASLPAGILQQLDVEVQHYRLQPGDMMVMLTDGLLELRHPHVDGEQQVTELLSQFQGEDPAQLARFLLGQLSELGLQDDVTLLVARVSGPRTEGFPLPEPEAVGVYRRR